MRLLLTVIILLFSSLNVQQNAYAQQYISQFRQFKAVSCLNASDKMITGKFGGWKVSSKPREKFEKVNFTACFPTMLLCRNWLKSMEKIYSILPAYQQACLRDRD